MDLLFDRYGILVKRDLKTAEQILIYNQVFQRFIKDEKNNSSY